MPWLITRKNYIRTRWPDDRVIEKVKESILEGELTDQQIADIFDLSVGQVERIRRGATYREVGPSLYDRHHRSRSKYSRETVERVHQLALTGALTHREIGEKLGIPRPTVTSILNGESHRDLYMKYWSSE